MLSPIIESKKLKETSRSIQISCASAYDLFFFQVFTDSIATSFVAFAIGQGKKLKELSRSIQISCAFADDLFFFQVFTDSIATAYVAFAIGQGLGKLFALKHGLRVFPNQELRAQGVANLVGGCFGCIPIAGSLSRSVVQEASGCK